MADDTATVTVRLPDVLLALFPRAERQVTVTAATVADAIAALNARWPGMRDRLCDSTPAIRGGVNVFVGGKRATLRTPLRPGTEIIILTAIRGG